MFHLAAYFESVAAVANTDVNALTDDVLFIQNNHFVYDRPVNLLWAYASGASLTRARINAPKLRQISPEYIRPISASLLPPTDPNICYFLDQPLKLRENEEIALEATGTSAGENTYGIIAVGDIPGPVPAGDCYNIRYTHATTVTASAWTTVTLTYEQQLPYGQYAVVGGDYFGTTAIAWRLILDQQYWRPGHLGLATAGLRLPNWAYQRRLGVWGYFNTVSLPRLQVLCNAADTAGEGYLQIIKVA